MLYDPTQIRCDCGLHPPMFDPEKEPRAALSLTESRALMIENIRRNVHLFTNAEFQAAEREATYPLEGDPTLDAPPLTDADSPEEWYFDERD